SERGGLGGEGRVDGGHGRHATGNRRGARARPPVPTPRFRGGGGAGPAIGREGTGRPGGAGWAGGGGGAPLGRGSDVPGAAAAGGSVESVGCGAMALHGHRFVLTGRACAR